MSADIGLLLLLFLRSQVMLCQRCFRSLQLLLELHSLLSGLMSGVSVGRAILEFGCQHCKGTRQSRGLTCRDVTGDCSGSLSARRSPPAVIVPGIEGRPPLTPPRGDFSMIGETGVTGLSSPHRMKVADLAVPDDCF